MEARVHCQLGRAYTRLYRFDDAEVHLHRALELAVRAGDRTEQSPHPAATHDMGNSTTAFRSFTTCVMRRFVEGPPTNVQANWE
jgi:hypothetical protein